MVVRAIEMAFERKNKNGDKKTNSFSFDFNEIALHSWAISRG